MLVAVLLCPDEVQIHTACDLQKCPISGTPFTLDLEYQHGTLAIEVSKGRLMIGLGPAGEPPPNITITTSYYRADDDLFYPEFLIPVTGYVQISRRPD